MFDNIVRNQMIKILLIEIKYFVRKIRLATHMSEMKCIHGWHLCHQLCRRRDSSSILHRRLNRHIEIGFVYIVTHANMKTVFCMQNGFVI